MKVIEGILDNDKRIVKIDNNNEKISVEIEYKKLNIEKISNMLRSKHELTHSNDIFKKFLVPVESIINLKALTTLNSDTQYKGYKYTIESFENHIKKPFIKFILNDPIIYDNLNYYIYETLDKHLITVFKEDKSFREVENLDVIKHALNMVYTILKERNENQENYINFFSYIGIKTNFYFTTRPVNHAYFNNFIIYTEEFIKNIELNLNYYKQDVYYVEPIY